MPESFLMNEEVIFLVKEINEIRKKLYKNEVAYKEKITRR